METQETVTQWAVETFGNDGSDLRCATRANEEMAELLSCLSRPDPDLQAVAAEQDDVCIVLFRLGTRLAEPLSLTTALPEWTVKETALRWALSANSELAWVMIDNTEGRPIEGQRNLRYALEYIRGCALSLNIDLQAAIDHKMSINRQRTWKLDGSGHGYHVKETP